MIEQLLAKDTLAFLDEIALEVFNLGVIHIFPYKSFSETLNLVMVSLLRELIQNAKGAILSF